jgi:hypothetical protein
MGRSRRQYIFKSFRRAAVAGGITNAYDRWFVLFFGFF